MAEVVSSIQRVTDIMGEISSASAEQSAGVAQVGEAVTQMDQATQQNAALVEESAAAASSLQDAGRADGAGRGGVQALARLTIRGRATARLGGGVNLLAVVDINTHYSSVPIQGTPMPRPLLDEAAIHPAIRQKVTDLHADLLRQAQAEVAGNAVMVFGMSGNPFVGKARKALDAAGVAHGYLEDRQLLFAVAPAQCAQDVDRLAHLPHGVRARRARGRRRRCGPAHRNGRTETAAERMKPQGRSLALSTRAAPRWRCSTSPARWSATARFDRGRDAGGAGAAAAGAVPGIRLTVELDGQQKWTRRIASNSPGQTDGLDYHCRIELPTGRALRIRAVAAASGSVVRQLVVEAREELPGQLEAARVGRVSTNRVTT